MSNPITAIKLTIDGVEIDLNEKHIRLNNVTPWVRDQPASFEFTQELVFPEPVDPWINKTVTLEINGNPVFYGRIDKRAEVLGQYGWQYGYRATGMEMIVSQWPVVSPFDGTSSVTYNLPPKDSMYDPTYAGLSLGEMIKLLFEEQSTAEYLHALNVGKYVRNVTTNALTLDARTLADLNDPILGGFLPPQPMTFAGDDLQQSIRAVLSNAAPNHCMWWELVHEDGKDWIILRFSDLSLRTTEIVASFAEQPPPELQRDYSNAYPRVVVRGGPNVQPVILTKTAGQIVEDFAWPPYQNTTLIAKQQWKLSTWLDQNTGRKITGVCWCRRPRKPSGPNEIDPLIDDGTGAMIPNPDYIADPKDSRLASPSYLLIDPDKPKTTSPVTPDYSWKDHEWGQNSNEYGGFLYVQKSVTGDPLAQVTVTRTVTDNTQLTAGDTCYLELSEDLPATDFTKFTMTASRWPGLQTWRRYKINANTSEGVPVYRRVQPAFPDPVPWVNGDGTIGSMTQSGVAQITYSKTSTGTTANSTKSAFIGFQVDRQTGHITFDRPLVTLFGSQTSLTAGGSTVDGQPDEITVLLPVSEKPLEAMAPLDTVLPDGTRIPNYNGTCHTLDNLTRTKYVSLRDWQSSKDLPMMEQWSRQMLVSIMDTVVEGSSQWYGFHPVMGPNHYMTWTDPCYTIDPYSRLTSDVRSCTIRWTHGNPVPVVTQYRLSNKLAAFSDESAVLLHPATYERPNVEQIESNARSEYGGDANDGNYGNYRTGATGNINDATTERAVGELSEQSADTAENGQLMAVRAIIEGRTDNEQGNVDAWREYLGVDTNEQ